MHRIGLERAGYLVRLATDGPSGLEEAIKVPPDLLLVDIRLPGFDGFQLLHQVRERVDTQDLPAVCSLISARTRCLTAAGSFECSLIS